MRRRVEAYTCRYTFSIDAGFARQVLGKDRGYEGARAAFAFGAGYVYRIESIEFRWLLAISNHSDVPRTRDNAHLIPYLAHPIYHLRYCILVHASTRLSDRVHYAEIALECVECGYRSIVVASHFGVSSHTDNLYAHPRLEFS